MATPSRVIVGNASPIESGYDITIRRGSGGKEQTRTFIGPDSAILPMVNTLLADASLTEIRASRAPNSAVGQISARFGRLAGEAETPEKTLTIRFNDVPIELHRHPHFIDISSTRIKALDDAARDNVSSVPTAGAELAYWTYKLRGVETYRVKLPVVTFTRTASAAFGTALVVADTGKIFTTTQVSAFVGSSILFAIPAANVGIASGSLGTYTVGWMQDTAVDFLANGNIQLIETYEFGLWEIAADPGDGFNLYVQG